VKTAAWLLCLLMMSAPLSAKERLGVYQGWAAFRDPATPRCYAIAAPEENVRVASVPASLSIGFWPKRHAHYQIQARLSQARARNSAVTLSADGRRFRLKAVGNTAWGMDRRMDRAIVAAIRTARSLRIEAIGADGKPIVDVYSLRGTPSAIDAAALGCIQI
jgi:hypothetical protein